MNKNEKGFTLIELGIVVAVIAILATVVLMGSGFVSSSRLAKAVEGVDVLKKASINYAGRVGGTFPTTAANLVALESRNLIDSLEDGAWKMAPGYKVTDLSLSYVDGKNEMVMTISFPDLVSGQDLYSNLSEDPGFTSDGDCAAPTSGDTSAKICFSNLI